MLSGRFRMPDRRRAVAAGEYKFCQPPNQELVKTLMKLESA
jgi:hypothetical protein